MEITLDDMGIKQSNVGYDMAYYLSKKTNTSMKYVLEGVANKKIELSFSLGTKRNYVRVGDRILSTITPAHQIRFYELLGREKDLEKAKIIAKHIGATEYSYRDKKQTPIRFATYVK